MRAKLWKGWFALAVFVVTLLVAGWVMDRKHPSSRYGFGLDYISFYRAGTLLREGRALRLYDLQDTSDFDQALAHTQKLDLGNTIGAYFNPPFFAWLFVPLVGFGYWKGLIAWELLNLGCCAGAVVMLCRMIPQRYDPDPNLEPKRDWRDVALVPLLLVVSLPFIQTIGHAQNAFISLLLLTWTVAMWREGKAFWAGIAIGLLFYKPQLAAVILGAVILTLGWRALAGAAASLGSLLLINILTLPGTLSDYWIRLRPDVKEMLSSHSYLWGRHATFNGFWHLSLDHLGLKAPAELASYLAIASAMPVAFGIVLCIWRNRKSVARDRMIAAVITAAPLIMPYYLDYDLILLAIPAVLLGAEMIDRDAAQALPRRDVWLLGLWAALFALLLVNPGLTHTLKVNLSVPLLVAVAGLMLARAMRTLPKGVSVDEVNGALAFQWPMAAGRA